jgi:chorismate mutase
LEEIKKEIEKLRREIDRVDTEIVQSLNKRAGLVVRIKEVKRKANIPLYDPQREEEIFEHLFKVNKGPLFDDDIKRIYEEILEVMKSLED